MKVLVLLKNNEKDDWIIDFVEKLIPQADEELTLLNIVVTPQEVPVKTNGEVLDVCTEYDLSGYHNTSKENLDYLSTVMTNHNVINRFSKVGRPIAIVEELVKNQSFDVLVAESQLMHGLRDRLMETCSTRLIDRTSIPFLTLKKNRRSEAFDSVAIIGDFIDPVKKDLTILKEIQKASNAKFTLVKIKTPSEELSDEQIMENMEKFRQLNELIADSLIYPSENKEDGVKSILKEKNFGLIALKSKKDPKGFSMFTDNLNADIVNHVDNPILIY